jgi:translocation and assembly module TamB
MSTNRAQWPGGGPQEVRRKPPQRPRRHWIAWVVLALTFLPPLLMLCLLPLVNTDGLHKQLLGLLQQKASESLGVEVRLQDFLLHYKTLSVDLYGVRAAGAAPYANPPLLTVDHIEAGVRIVSLFRREWYLDNLQIDHPVAWIVVDKNGVSNLPKPMSNSSSNTDIFQLGIRHAAINRGEVYYNSKPSALSAELHDVNFAASFSSLETRYKGRLAYKNGSLQYGTWQPLNHDLDVSFEATPDVFTLNSGTLVLGNSHATISATAKQYRTSPVIQAHYDLAADGAQLAQILHQAGLPAGMVRTSGWLAFERKTNRPLLDAMQVEGDLASSNLVFNGPSVRTDAKNIAAHYSLKNGDATLSYLRADLLGGQLTGRGTMTAIGGDSHSRFELGLKSISLAAMKNALGGASKAKDVALEGTGNATATATWGKTMKDLVVKSDVTVNGRMARAHMAQVQTANQGISAAANSTVPVEALLHATYVNDQQVLRLVDSYVKSDSTNVSMNGSISKNSSLALNLQANDLRELNTWMAMFPGKDGRPPSMDLAGTARFNGNVRGSLTVPHLTGQLNAENLHVNGTDWKVFRTGVDISPSRAALNNADLEPVNRGKITLDASIGLRDWSADKASAIQLGLNASQMDVATLLRLIGQAQPVTGTLNAQMNPHGSVDNPTGNGNISVEHATAYQQPIDSARVELSGTGNEAQARLNVQLPSGNVKGQVRVKPREKTFIADLDSSGIDLAKLKALKDRGVDVKGVIEAEAHGQGSFDNPEARATMQVASLSIGGREVTKLKLDATVKDRVANADLTSSAAKLPVHARARINLSGDYMTDATLDTQSMQIESLLAAYSPGGAGNLSGTTEVHATLHGPLKDKNQLEAHVTIPVLKAAYGNTVQLAAVAPIHMDFLKGVVNLQPATIEGTETHIQVQGAIPIDPNQPMSIKAQGTINLQLAQLLNPELRSSGQLRLNIDANGVGPGGTLGGEIDVINANIASADVPVGLQNANGVLKLKTDRVEIASFQGTAGGGTVTAQGAVVYRPQMQFDLGVTAKGVRMLYPAGVRESLNGNLRLAGTTENATLGGAVSLAELSFTPAFDLDTLIGSFGEGVSAPVEPGFTQNLALNIAVNSSNYVNLVSRTLSVAGTAALQIRGTAADPVVLGRVNLSGGDVILHGDRYVLTGGTVQFVNPSITEPILNVALTTTIQEYKINLRFNGPANQLHTQYTSDPSLPPADIINLLAFGKTKEAVGPQQSVTQQAESLVASQVSSQVTSRISKAAGISQLSISPVLAGSTTTGPPGAQITIRQRVTGNLFVTFSTNVASTQGQTIQGQYQVTPRVAVSATRSPNGGFAVDTLIKKTW